MRIRSTPSFKRAYRKFAKNNRQLQAKIDEALVKMGDDVFATSLRTHKLSGNLGWLYACSCGYDCRIVFEFVTHPETGEQELLLVDIGTHDDVY